MLSRVEFAPEELSLLRRVRGDRDLLDAAAHLDECGSLLAPTRAQMDAVAGDLAALSGDGSLFAGSAAEKLARLQAELAPLAERYDVVVANPPYMGSSNMNKWLASWTSNAYPDSKRDLCTCFIERGLRLSQENGYAALITSSTCMFISSFEKMREKLLRNHALVSLIETTGSNNHPDVFDANAGWVFINAKQPDLVGSYFKLSHPIPEKEARYLEALANPECGWFFRRSADAFEAIPGSPIAYWASESLYCAFQNGQPLSAFCPPRQGMATADNDHFLRLWWEVSNSKIFLNCLTQNEFDERQGFYTSHNKGGGFRRWYGNHDFIMRWKNNGEDVKRFANAVIRNESDYFKQGLSYSDLTSGKYAARRTLVRGTFDSTGPMMFPDSSCALKLIGFLNSSVFQSICNLKCTGMHYSNGELAGFPILDETWTTDEAIPKENIELSKGDWDAFETSWDFERHPLI